MDDSHTKSIEKIMVPDLYLSEQLEGLKARRLPSVPLSLCTGPETIFWSAKGGDHMLWKAHASKARCTFLSCWSRRKFDKQRLVSPCAALTLMCSRSMSDTSQSLVYCSFKDAGDFFFFKVHDCLSCFPLHQSCYFVLFLSLRSQTTDSNSAECLLISAAVISKVWVYVCRK